MTLQELQARAEKLNARIDTDGKGYQIVELCQDPKTCMLHETILSGEDFELTLEDVDDELGHIEEGI